MTAAKGTDPLLAQPRGGIPYVRVEEPLFRVHCDGAPEGFAASELREGRIGWGIEGEAEPLGGGELLVVDSRDEEIDLLAQFVADYVGVRREAVDVAKGVGTDNDA
jgi:hypothetical protein